MKSLYRAIVISRPIFWPTTFLGFILGIVFSGHTISYFSLIFAFMWSFPYSLWICSVNDFADTKSDRMNPLKGGLSGAKIAENELSLLLKLQSVSLFMMVIPTVLTLNARLWITTFSALLIPYLYSVFPYRLKEKPPLDSFANGAVACFVFLSGYFFNTDSVLNLKTVQTLLGFFFGVSAIHVIGALRDYASDKKAHVRTVAVALGQKKSALFAMILFFFLFLSIYNFPIEFRLYAVYGMACMIILFIKPGGKLSERLGFTLLIGFFIAAIISLSRDSI